ncbi:hypothetical protein [Pseudanabaena sp. PCC 6802]|uniref:hypothetical protein n=1 Tax=Pseudanabaena sp. PCC 6802 TaxID=118173 RepID=UPI00034C9F4C|nr:hypothetical protein [Pseudanabaena sp. PCC 6802]
MKSGTLPSLSSKAASFALDTLRVHYNNLAAEYESLASNARSQLKHIDALLQSVPVTPKSFALETVSVPAQPKATAVKVPESVEPAPAKPAKAPKPAKAAPQALTKAPKAAAAAITKAPAKSKRAEIISVAPPKGKATKVAAKAVAAVPKGKGGRNGKLTMKAPYGSLTMLDAIGSVLESNKGKPVSADSVVDTLYGSLSGNQLKIAKDRVTKSLSKGKIEDRWDRVPNQMGVYTLSLASMK